MISSLRGILAKSCPHLIKEIEFGGCVCPSGAGWESNKHHHHTAVKLLKVFPAWATCSPWAGYWSFWQPGRGWNVGTAMVWDNLRAVKPSWTHEQLQHCLPCVHNPEQHVQRWLCPWEDKKDKNLFNGFAEVQWTAVAARLTHRGSAHHGHKPWSRDSQPQEPALMTFYKSRYFQLADIWHWFINPAAGTILLSCVDKNLASPIKDWFVSWEKIIYCFHIIASAILG